MTLTFDHVAKRVLVPQVDAQPLLIQALVNAIREEEASERGIAYDSVLVATGKDVLASGVTTGITASLLSTWRIEFAAGAYQATIDGGNLADALSRIVNTGSPQVLINSSAAATIAAGEGGGTAPTATAVASAVRAELTPELERIDVAVSSRVPTGATIPADVRQMNGATVIGNGTSGNKWRGSGV